MAGDVVVKIDADTAAYIAKIAKMADAHEVVGKRIKSSGDGLESMVGKVGSLVAGFASAGAILGTMDDAVGRIRDKIDSMSHKTGDLARSLTPALESIGMTPKEQDAAIKTARRAEGHATTEQIAGIWTRIAAINDEGKRLHLPGITKQQGEDFVAAAGAYGEVGLGANFGLLWQQFDSPNSYRGQGVNVAKKATEIARSRPGFNAAYALETATQDAARAHEEETRNALDPTGVLGAQSREGAAAFDSDAAQHPFATMKAWVMGKISSVAAAARDEQERRNSGKDVVGNAIAMAKRSGQHQADQHPNHPAAGGGEQQSGPVPLVLPKMNAFSHWNYMANEAIQGRVILHNDAFNILH